MDIRIVELASRLTDKAMGAESFGGNWIGNETAVAEFLRTIATTLNSLYNDDRAPED